MLGKINCFQKSTFQPQFKMPIIGFLGCMYVRLLTFTFTLVKVWTGGCVLSINSLYHKIESRTSSILFHTLSLLSISVFISQAKVCSTGKPYFRLFAFCSQRFLILLLLLLFKIKKPKKNLKKKKKSKSRNQT